jgi:hypothetical protein
MVTELAGYKKLGFALIRGRNYSCHISVHTWCVVVGGNLNEPNTFPHRLTGDVYHFKYEAHTALFKDPVHTAK